MKFEDDLKKYRHDAAISYLGQLLKTREDIKVQLGKPNKDLGECMNYLMSCARKQRKGKYAVMSDDEALSMAVHYYDEDDIKVEQISGAVSASPSPVLNNNANENDKDSNEDVEKLVRERVEKELEKIKEEESKNKRDEKEEIEKMVSERVMNELERIREEEKKSKEEKKARRTASRKNESNENTTTIFDFMED